MIRDENQIYLMEGINTAADKDSILVSYRMIAMLLSDKSATWPATVFAALKSFTIVINTAVFFLTGCR